MLLMRLKSMGVVGFAPSTTLERLNLSERPLLRLLTLCILYVAQGIPYGFVTITLAAYLAESNATTGQIGGLLAMGTLPWTFK